MTQENTIPVKDFGWPTLAQAPILRNIGYGDGMGGIIGSTWVRCPSLATHQWPEGWEL